VILYEYECKEHGIFDSFTDMDKRDSVTCPKCAKKAKRIMSASHVYVDFTPGFDHGLNTYVSTKAQRDNLVREKGLVRYKD